MAPPSPVAVEPSSIIEALIVGGDADWLFLVLTPYYLEVARASILDVEELPVPETVHAEHAIAARITLQPGAVIRALRSSHDLERAIRRQRWSFATVSRPDGLSPTDRSPALTAKTQAFYARFGITVEPGAS